LARSDANLEVAKRENAVILYENDYQTRYAGFNPNSVESYIIFEFMQDKFMEQSVHLASLVQEKLRTSSRRIDRGVHQAGFLVLKASAMPSILIELGFISTPVEERFLASEEGATTMAKGIYEAFMAYKKEHDLRQASLVTANTQTATPATVTVPQTTAATSSGIIFKVQILTSPQPLATNDARLRGLTGVSYYIDGGLYKYTAGDTSNYNEAVTLRRSLTQKFKDAFVVAFRDGQRMDINEAIKLFKNSSK
jgi:N-acetylmuramoyl-L-alanine amidase